MVINITNGDLNNLHILCNECYPFSLSYYLISYSLIKLSDCLLEFLSVRGSSFTFKYTNREHTRMYTPTIYIPTYHPTPADITRYWQSKNPNILPTLVLVDHNPSINDYFLLSNCELTNINKLGQE